MTSVDSIALNSLQIGGDMATSGRHGRDEFFILGEGLVRTSPDGTPVTDPKAVLAATVDHLFSRFFPGLKLETEHSTGLLIKLATAMVDAGGKPDSTVPSGYTYLGQFLDHDLTLDRSELDLTKPIKVEELISRRSPTLDLDSLYGDGPKAHPRFYEADGVHLARGRPQATGLSPGATQDGMDLPRHRGGAGPELRTEREARIPDVRNDENLAVAQIHAAFIRFHNRVVDKLIQENTPSLVLFDRAREIVTKHYQWMVIHDYLPRIASPDIVRRVFTEGRQHFELDAVTPPTMPVEFSGAAFRLGHSQVRESYEWNKFFNRKAEQEKGAQFSGHLFRLFRFCGTSGSMEPSELPPGSIADIADIERPKRPGVELPDIWVADYTRLFSFPNHPSIPAAADEDFNHAMAIDAHVVEPLKNLPIGSFASIQDPDLAIKRSLAFRNLARGRMLALASGQQLAQKMGVKPLTLEQLTQGNGSITLEPTLFDQAEFDELAAATPLWFYIVREAETSTAFPNKLDGVGATLVAETFHRAIQASENSILADPSWRPTLGDGDRFDMSDLLFFAFEGKPELLNPHGA